MAFAQATFDVHWFYQKVAPLPLPYTLDRTTKDVNFNPNFNRRQHTLVRYISDFATGCMGVAITWRLCWLYKHWKDFTHNHIEQLIVYLLAQSAIIIYVAFYYTHIHETPTLLYTIKQMMKIQIQKRVAKSFGNFSKTCLVYGFAFGGILTVITVGAATLIVSYCPIQLLLGVSWKSKIIGSTLYLFLTLRIVCGTFSPLLLSLTFLEGAIDYSAQLQAPKWGVMQRVSILLQFYNRFRRYEILRLLLVVAAKASELLYTTLISVGVLMVSFAGLATLQMYGQVNILVYIPVSFLFVAGIIMTTVFTHLACIPSVNVHSFCRSWKKLVKRDLARKMLGSVPVIGFKLGPYGLATKTLGLLICEDIMNNILDLMLIQQF